MACAIQRGQDVGTGPGWGPTKPPLQLPGPLARISASRRVTLASCTAMLLSRVIRAWDRLGVSTLQTPWFTGSPGVYR